eukprot:TRINITY_DN5838_c0_g1_i4.p1 TRINITY_DN5838_c0_g1~~TRINITY_DN5838_c0_g1_i4.p1  ORF type:complete len:111 (-),score=13.48 TRINITY_DN5838_c0_g1_i4:51-383(-)
MGNKSINIHLRTPHVCDIYISVPFNCSDKAFFKRPLWFPPKFTEFCIDYMITLVIYASIFYKVNPLAGVTTIMSYDDVCQLQVGKLYRRGDVVNFTYSPKFWDKKKSKKG